MRADQDNRNTDSAYRRAYGGITSEAQLRDLASQGMTTAQIALHLDVSAGMLKNTLAVLGIKLQRKPRKNPTTVVFARKDGADVAKANNPFRL